MVSLGCLPQAFGVTTRCDPRLGHVVVMMAILAARVPARQLAQIRVSSHISKIDGVYVCSFTVAETKNRRELQLATSNLLETGLGGRAAQKVDLLRTAVPAVEQEPPAADIEMAGPKPSEALPNWLISLPGSVFGGSRSR